MRSQDALEAYERETYPVLMENRLAGRRVAALFVGSFEGELAESVQQTIDDAGRQPGAARAPGPDPDG